MEDLRTRLKKLPLDVKKVINGKEYIVKYDKFGFPKFEKYAPEPNYFYRSPKGGNLIGNYEVDNLNALNWLKNKSGLVENIDFKQIGDGKGPILMKIMGKWKKCSWHHHQDGKTLIPVISEIHNTYNHTGSISIINNFSELIGFFK